MALARLTLIRLAALATFSRNAGVGNFSLDSIIPARTRRTIVGMPVAIHWINLPMPGRLAIMPRPRAGDWLDDEIAGWRTAGINIVVSLLEREEVAELGLEHEQALCSQLGLQFVSFPITDRQVPNSWRAAAVLAGDLAAWLDGGASVAVHCRAGIGRSSLIAASALICLGIEASDALQAIGSARGVAVPDTEEQRAWVMSFRPT